MHRPHRAVGLTAGVALVLALTAVPSATARTSATPNRSDGKSTAVVPVSADLQVTSTSADATGAPRSLNETQRFYRDSHGRTRTETQSKVTITDPTSQTTLVLDPKARTFQRRVQDRPTGSAAPGADTASHDKLSSAPRQLGKTTIDGIPVEGNAYTVTIPARDAAPSQRKEVTIWHAVELQLPLRINVVDSTGEQYSQAYTNVRAGAEPAGDLFEIPSDYSQFNPAATTSAPAPASAGPPFCAMLGPLTVSLTSIDTLLARFPLEVETVEVVPIGEAVYPSCYFTQHGGTFDYPMVGAPVISLPSRLYDAWLIFDGGGDVPYLPYVAFGSVEFLAQGALAGGFGYLNTFIVLTIY